MPLSHDEKIEQFLTTLRLNYKHLKEITVSEAFFNDLCWYLSDYLPGKEIYDSGKLEGSIYGITIRGIK